MRRAAGFLLAVLCLGLSAPVAPVHAALAAPTGVKASTASSGTTISWNAVAGAAKYAIYRGTTAGGEDTIPVNSSDVGTSFVDSTAQNGTYYYTVKAIDASGTTSPASAEVSAKVGTTVVPTGNLNPIVTAQGAPVSPPSADGACHFVLTTIPAAQVQSAGITDCNKVSFSVYLAALLNSLVPYVLLIAIIAIVFSGLQYMLASAGAGDTKAAKQRVLGIISGVIFYFLIRLILNQLAPGISL